MNDNEFEIKENIELPAKVLTAYENSELVLFIGAGISRLMGCKGWEDMANDLIKAICKGALEDQIRNSRLDSKAKITIAKRLAEKEAKENIFWDIFKKAINTDDKAQDIYSDITNLYAPIITTNCDGLLPQHFQNRCTTNCSIEEFNRHNGSQYLYCIHGLYGNGTQKDIDTLVFTANQYLEKYSGNGSLVSFLKHVFRTNTVLFLGCGLNEFEILNTAFDSEHETGDKKHYVLEGFYPYQQEYCNAIGQYYKSIGIQLLPYSKEKNGYDQQRFIIPDWINQLAHQTNYYSRRITGIGKVLADYSNAHQTIVSDYLSQSINMRKIYLQSIFEYLPHYATCFEWICFLIEQEYLKPEILADIFDTNKKEYLSAQLFNTISLCLSQYEIKDYEKQVLTRFINACITFASFNERFFSYPAVVTDLLQSCIALGIMPSNESQWYIWDKAEATLMDGGYTIITENYNEIKKWDTNIKVRIFSNVFSPPESRLARAKDYWLTLFAEFLVQNCDTEISVHIAKQCLALYFEEEENPDFYRSFVDRYQMRELGYAYSLVESAKILILSFKHREKGGFFTNLFVTANGSLQIQTLLYLAVSADCLNANIIRKNPLAFENTFVDFYYWLNAFYVKSVKISKQNKDRIARWIETGSFGIDANHFKDGEYREILERRNNTYKYMLFELLSGIDPSYREQLAVYSNKDRIRNAKNPVEDSNSYKSFVYLDPEEYFPKSIDPALKADVLIQQVKKADQHAKWPNDFYIYQEAYRELLGKTSKKQTKEIFTKSLELPFNDLVDIFRTLNSEEVIRKCSKSFLQNYIKNVVKRIQQEAPLYKKIKPIVDCIIDFSGLLDKHGWKKTEVFHFLIQLNLDQYIASKEKYSEKTNVSINILNSTESNYYRRIIETAYQCNTPQIVKQLKNWVNEKLQGKPSNWFYLSLAFCVSNLIVLDEEWTRKTIFPIMNKRRNKERLGLCMVNRGGFIYKGVVDFLVDNNLILKISEHIRNSEQEVTNADMFLTYCVAAYYYDYLDLSQYRIILNNISEEKVNHVIWSCINGIKNGEQKKKKQLLKETYYTYIATHDSKTIDVAVLRLISGLEWLDADCWQLIDQTLQNCLDEPDIWHSVLGALKQTKVKNSTIPKVIAKLYDSKAYLDYYYLKQIMYNIGKLRMFDTVTDIARHYVEVGGYGHITDLQKYIEKPEQILIDVDNK